MDYIYTKDGRPLRVKDDDLFDESGQHVARLRKGKAYNPNGIYVGTIVDGRLIYRSTNSAGVGPVYAPRVSAGFAKAIKAPTGKWGDEPHI